MIHAFFIIGLMVLDLRGADEQPKEQSPFSYYKDTDKDIPYLGDGCCTVLTMPEQKVLVGPHLESPLIVLWNNYKTLVAYKNAGTSVRSLLAVAHKWFGTTDLSSTRGFIYTHRHDYEAHDDTGMSAKAYHEGRTQNEELKHIEKQLIQGLKLDAHAPDALKTHIFDDTSMHHDPQFPTAPVFLIIKHTDQGPQLFHVCPIVEDFFKVDDPHCQSIKDKIELLREKLARLRSSENPYYKALGDNFAAYGSRNFEQVQFKKNWDL